MKKYNNYNIHTPNFCFIAISLNVDIFVIVLEVLQTGESSHFSNSGSGYPHFSNSGFGYPHFSNSGSGYPHFSNSGSGFPHISNSSTGYPHLSNSGSGYPHFSNSGSGYPPFGCSGSANLCLTPPAPQISIWHLRLQWERRKFKNMLHSSSLKL